MTTTEVRSAVADAITARLPDGTGEASVEIHADWDVVVTLPARGHAVCSATIAAVIGETVGVPFCLCEWGLDCIPGKHLFFDIHDETGKCVGGWCPWCGTAAYDGDRITDDGSPVGFTPTYRIRVPDEFHRDPARGGASPWPT